MANRTLFRPCIDLHEGKVKQIVGGTLDSSREGLKTNFVSDRSAAWFAELYSQDSLTGGHVIMLGPGNEVAAESALRAYPLGLQIGGGITTENAGEWLDRGASHVIATSYLFDGEARFRPERLEALKTEVGRERLVIDLSCRRKSSEWIVAMNRWQTPTDLAISYPMLDELSDSCSEFLIHAADVEGLCSGIDEDLVSFLGNWGRIPITYAGGANSVADLKRVDSLSAGKIDLTIGSALDIFGGENVKYADCVAYNQVPLS